MLSQSFVFRKSENFTSDNWIRMPPTVPVDHDCRPENQQNRTRAALFHYSMLTYSKRPACLEHSNLFKVNVPNSPTAAIKSRRGLRETLGAAGQCSPLGGPHRPSADPRRGDREAYRDTGDDGPRNPTTSVLTTANIVYAIGAGITAAAGTRLALQLFLVKGFGLYSFQLPDLYGTGIVIYRHYLPESGLGNLRACCLPWMW